MDNTETIKDRLVEEAMKCVKNEPNNPLAAEFLRWAATWDGSSGNL